MSCLLHGSHCLEENLSIVQKTKSQRVASSPFCMKSASSLETNVSAKVSLGKDCQCDEGVTLAYPTDRKTSQTKLIIGDHARIRSGSVIYQGSSIGSHLTTGHNVIIREDNRIGNHFSIWSNSIVDYGSQIGHGVKIHSNCYIAQFTTIEDNAFLAPGVTVANDLHPGCQHSQDCMKGPTIGKSAQIGVNATILPFVTIGDRAVIGSGAVVVQDVPPRSVVVGNPGQVICTIDDLECKTGLTDFPYRLKLGERETKDR